MAGRKSAGKLIVDLFETNGTLVKSRAIALRELRFLPLP